MIRKSFAFILLGILCVAPSFSQTPETGAKGESKVFSMFFDGHQGYLGIETEDVTRENFAKYGLREVRGVAVEKVVDGSAAQTAGLQAGDVIVKLNGENITSVRKLTRLIGEIAPDHQAKVTFLRGGDEREITVTLGKRPAPKFEEGAFSPAFPGRQDFKFEFPPMPAIPPMPPMAEMPRIQTLPPTGEYDRDFYVWRSGSGRQIGISVSPLTKQLSDHFGVAGGVMINNVRENSPAAKAGLKAGDIIVEVEGKAVTSDFDLVRAIGEKKVGDVVLTIVRDRNRQTIRVTPEEVKRGFNTFFETPEDAPEAFKIARPATPKALLAPVPLNRIHLPGRIL